MSKSLKRLFSVSAIVLALLIVVNSCAVAFAAEKSESPVAVSANGEWTGETITSIDLNSGQYEIIQTGVYSDTMEWTIVKDLYTGLVTFVVSGEGDMPDIASADREKRPYHSIRKSINNVIIEDGITKIGANTFYDCSVATVSIGKDVVEIGATAFYYCAFNRTDIVVPGTVKTIGGAAFGAAQVNDIILEEGVESITGNIVCYTSSGIISRVVIPSTVKTINGDMTIMYGRLEIAEDNPYFFVEDDVLYRVTSESPKTASLHSYLRLKDDMEFTIPAEVKGYKITSLTGAPFQNNNSLKKLTIPSTLTTAISSDNIINATSIEEVYIESGVKISNNNKVFAGDPYLKRVVYDDNTFTTHYIPMMSDSVNLEELYVTTDTNYIRAITSAKQLNFTELIYNAIDCKNFYKQADLTTKYHLEIGSAVDYLRGTESGSDDFKNGFQSILKNASSVTFVGENQITIVDGVFNGMNQPLSNLTGTIWVDAAGVVYKYDKGAKTATVAYVPAGIENVTIPESITVEGVSCTVNSVDKYSFRLAKDTRTVNIENPANIKNIGTFSFATENIESINGRTKNSEIKALFTNASYGYMPFVESKLVNDDNSPEFNIDIKGQKSISSGIDEGRALHIELTNDQSKWVGDDTTGQYVAYTGENVGIHLISGGDTSGESAHRYRVYFESSDTNSILTIKPGETKVIGGTSITCYATDAENICYVEFDSIASGTLNTNIGAIYPSPNSAGGAVKVWGFCLTKAEAEETQGTIMGYSTEGKGENAYMTDAISIKWITKKDNYSVTKTAPTGVASMTADGQGSLQLPSFNFNVQYKNDDGSTGSVGKDLVKSVEFFDELDISAFESDGINGWNPELIDAIRNNEVYYYNKKFYIGVAAICDLEVTSSGTLSDVNMYYDEERDKVGIYWKVVNSRYSSNEDMGTISTRINFATATYSIAENQAPSSGKTKDMINKVHSVTHYTYADDVESDTSVTRQIKADNATFSININQSPDKEYFGTDTTFRIDVFNNGVRTYTSPAGNEYDLRFNKPDNNSRYLYFKPENMEKMFADIYGDKLTFKINNALIKPYENVVSVDGGVAHITGANSDNGYSYEDIIISKADNGSLIITRANGKQLEVTGSLKEALESIGYAVGFETTFIPSWELNRDTPVVLYGKEVHRYYVYASFKDTFMLLDSDLAADSEFFYPAEEITLLNYATIVYDNQTKAHAEKKVSSTAAREYKVNRYVTDITNSTANDNLQPKLEDILEHKIALVHYASGVRDDLPIVDTISGVQAVLAPVDKNPQLAKEGLRKIQVSGKSYYLLNESGVYNSVTLGTDQKGNALIADSVTVTDNGKMLTTSIKWYYESLNDAYRKDISYYAYVDPDSYRSSAININAMTYINDKTDDRIYAKVTKSSSLIDFDKSIVTQDSKGRYIEDEDDYSIIENGEPVTYNLKLFNSSLDDITVDMSEVFDRLPNTFDGFKWDKSNVALSYVKSDGVTDDSFDDWYITDELFGVKTDGVYYIKWNSANVNFSPESEVNIYVTLTFPQNESWTEYCQSANGDRIYNSLGIKGTESSVSHDIKSLGRGFLQKGVYGTYRYTINKTYTDELYTFKDSGSRINYNNKDATSRAICYYIVVYNEAYNKLYLHDIFDKLPKGFKYISLAKQSMLNGKVDDTLTNSITTSSGNSYSQITNADVEYKDIVVKASQEGGSLRFALSQPGSASNPVLYDEEKEMCYLKHNQAIVFGVMIDTGESDNTENIALNTAAMKYEDYLYSGFEVSDKSSQARLYDGCKEQNDGLKLFKTTAQLKANGCTFANAEEEEQGWLVSESTVKRGGIVPGVANKTVSSVIQGGVTEEYHSTVKPAATINWRSTLSNAGASVLLDYTVADTLPKNYSITNTVSLDIYEGDTTKLASYTLFKVESIEETGNVTISSRYSGKDYTYTLKSDGTLTEITISNGEKIKVGYERSKAVDDYIDTLILKLSKSAFAIPEKGGTAVLNISTANLTSNCPYTVYTNQTTLMPVQLFDSIDKGSAIYEGGTLYAVQNSSSANVSPLTSSTIAKKTVYELDNTDNKTDSDSDTKYIILSSNTGEFRYSLDIENDVSSNISKLVIIDELPEKGDHNLFHSSIPRNSDYRVILSDNPDFTFTYKKNNSSTAVEIDKSSYKVEYSSKTTYTQADWNGESSTDWHEWNSSVNPEDVHSIRVVFRDLSADGSSSLPTDTTISLGFNCRVLNGESIEPGLTAWNSFGYRFSAADTPDLEAMALPVGTKTSAVPVITKTVIDRLNNEYKVAEDTEFGFIVYEGEEVKVQNGESLQTALANADRKYKSFKLTVPQGESSAKLNLRFDDFEWVNGEKYTIVESSVPKSYSQNKWNDVSASSNTFIYDQNKGADLRCENQYIVWSFNVSKESDFGTKLSGAEFGIYTTENNGSPNTYLDSDGNTWYLYKNAVTDSEGNISFTKLTASKYYLVETKAPSGYSIDWIPKIISATEMGSTVTVRDIYRPQIIGSTLTIENRIGVNFYVYMGGTAKQSGSRYVLDGFDEDRASKYEMHFRFKDKDGRYIDEKGNPVSSSKAYTEVKVFDKNEINFMTVSGKVRPLFRFTHWCYAFEMADAIEATMFKRTEEGVVQVTVNPIDYSVRTYADSMLTKSDSVAPANLKAMLKDMLNYGAYSQKYWNHNTADLANKNLSAADQNKVLNCSSIDSRYAVQKTTGLAGVSAESIQLEMTRGASFSVQLKILTDEDNDLGKFTPTLSSDTVKYLKTASGQTTLPCTLFENNFVSTGKEGEYTIKITNIPVYRWDDSFNLSFTGKDNPGSQYSVKFSLLSYIYSAVNEKAVSDTNLVNLLKSMYLYNQTAQSYFSDVEQFENIMGLPTHGAGSGEH